MQCIKFVRNKSRNNVNKNEKKFNLLDLEQREKRENRKEMKIKKRRLI